jgi:hypothetical protein
MGVWEGGGSYQWKEEHQWIASTPQLHHYDHVLWKEGWIRRGRAEGKCGGIAGINGPVFPLTIQPCIQHYEKLFVKWGAEKEDGGRRMGEGGWGKEGRRRRVGEGG